MERFKGKTGKELLKEYVQVFKENVQNDEGLLEQYIQDLSSHFEKIKSLVEYWETKSPSKQQETIINERYVWTENNETWDMLSRRVSRTIVSQLVPYFEEIVNETNKNKLTSYLRTIENIFYRIIKSRISLPNTPTLINAGLTIYRKTGNIEREKYLLYSETLTFDEYKELYEVLDRTYQLSQCNVLSTEDSMEQILETFNKQTLISKAGGGIGLNFGKLRFKNAPLSNGGFSSGSISFMEMFDSMLKTIKQGGKNRRGQGMQTHGFGNLNNKEFWKEEFSIHPDAIDFIKQKENNTGESKLSNFNLSFVINNTKSFIKKLENDEYVNTVFNNTIYQENYMKVSELFTILSEKQWKSGDPGLVFLDKVNKYNPLQKLGLNIESTNVCGEIPILSSFEHKIIGNCNLISIDLFKFINTEEVFINQIPIDEIFKTNNYIKWDELKSLVVILYEFLDLLLDLLMFPVDDNNRGSMLLRNIGIGISSLAGLLSWLNIPYDSNNQRILSMNLMTILEVEGFKQSVKKSQIFGDYLLFEFSDKNILPNYLFTNIDNDLDPFVSMLQVYNKSEIKELISQLKEHRRNIFVTTVQPSGTVGILMQTEEFGDTGQGIEPFFSLYYIRKYRIPNTDNEWNTLEYMNKLLEIKMDKLGIKDKDKILGELKNYGGKIDKITSIPSYIRKQFVTSLEIHYLDHLKMLEQIQISNSQQISKTINMTKDQTVSDVQTQYLYQIKSPIIKGITIYRDGSLEVQVLNTTPKKEEKKEEIKQESIQNKKEEKKVEVSPQFNLIFVNDKNKIVPRPRKETLKSVTRKVKMDDGTLYITLSFDDNDEVTEVFLSNGNEIQELIGRLTSLLLRSGVDLDVILEQLSKIKNGKYSQVVFTTFKTMIDDQVKLGIIKSHKHITVTNDETDDKVQIDEVSNGKTDTTIIKIDELTMNNGIYYDNDGNHYCPSCLSKNSIVKGEGCQSCSVCGWSKCS